MDIVEGSAIIHLKTVQSLNEKNFVPVAPLPSRKNAEQKSSTT